mmetsp:Transcript_21892/g.28338  ORF Transcript_21892/g.28338 Transcript_21892/m.28338 type:complete len:636 (+) Transcript_21892:232-2139(+)|eukprot:CAMPEP_0198146590 /NCGR_PEP_ID=MMETSP1443-20131203/30135_1 /TAXON_ID=186043 /ORGANISM="Entomoneis sp., Strain CCMP2396" /LENGTH=635 /DNA_ID=CAMNT_0043810605 /DNA_START=229 /DNA_END=2136 /DNA_ORIENTATION=+
MTKRDPFPMSSAEADALSASVEGPQSGASRWHSMSTTATETSAASSSRGVSGEKEASEGLVHGKNPKSNPDDIYEDIDKDADEDREDDFLDRPLWELHGSTWDRMKGATQRGLQKLYRRFYGDDLPISEMLRTLCLASTLFFMIGGYWTLRSLKDPVLMALNGVKYIPIAKMLSVVVILGVVPIYNHLLDSGIQRHRLFYLFGTVYFCLFMMIALGLMHPEHGLSNTKPSPYRILGWLSYCGIESFGSIMVSLFWSFANSNFSLKEAKASYGVMVAAGQIGSILGPTLVNVYSDKWEHGVAKLYMIGAACMLLLQGTVHMYVSFYGAEERNVATGEAPKKKKSAGVLEGVHLFIKHNYVKGIFAISCLFMVEVTIIDYTMKMLARKHFADEHPCQEYDDCYGTDGGLTEEATAAVTRFMGMFGQATNGLSFLMSLLGTSAVIRYLGLRLTLLLFPSLCLVVIIVVRLRPTLYVVFLAMILLKGFSYSLNNPTKEMLYQPTSQAVRYKAKSWIDTFGARGSKALGSLVTNAFSDSASALISNGSLVGIAVASFLIFNARFMGRKFDEYMETGHIVGEEDSEIAEDGGSNIEMGVDQNNVPDTSCAIEDDDEVGPEEEGQIPEHKEAGDKTAEVARV